MQGSKLSVIAAVIGLVASSPSWAANVPSDVTLAKEQVLVRGNGDEVPTLDPSFSSDSASSRVIGDMFEGLVTQSPEGEIIPALATRWEQSADGKVYTFHLRDNITWSNGEPITAGDFVYSFRRVINPKTAAPYAWYYGTAHIKNATAISEGKVPVEELGVSAPDDKTFQITLDKPVPYLLKMLVHESTYPVYQPAIEAHGDTWTRPEHIVTSSAYKLKEWTLNERIVLERNSNYWNNAKTVINQVKYLPIVDMTAEYNRYRTGEIDITSSFPLEQYNAIKKQRPDELLTMPSLGTYYYLFNVNKKPFDDPRVRKALAYAIDRDVVTNVILGQGQIPAYGLTPPSVDGFAAPRLSWGELNQKERNQKAKQLLEEAGFNAANPLKFELVYNTLEAHKKLAIVMSSMWKKTLGADVELANQEWKTFLQKLSQRNFSVARYAWMGDYNEASTFLSFFDSQGMNYGDWSNPKYDEVMAKAILAKDSKGRNHYYQQAEQIFAEEMPAIPLYHYTRSVLKNPKVGGYSTTNASDARYTRDLYKIQ
ncbi:MULTISPECIES: peptide ABC transporter substrate-binding protein [Photobacterium]|uniref:Peptide ABC transporter substrate-binding protein n=1 Tax=Photobacterium ganghwense TaxID=320778 RepID=A0A0J1HA64_9GAMM|nr:MULTISPECIES: peptide ABC transporter substrate-binding protein [Photobacterium]KLV08578.1 peptide ABC transporter substrate-binding protein [Photobacterium ganghwense]MBV1839095.1 peptide ABC transporter substrate-binding protein [Photobacterium ganghwense]PSU10692.1 peptide ABC transporter substrate-binding protein [Photobacterium ganghwense]QSV12836.1 peptide ABC transporter substrate-binding protein [Photobacterium ganghwense]